jgi:hypothetical protein
MRSTWAEGKSQTYQKDKCETGRLRHSVVELRKVMLRDCLRGINNPTYDFLLSEQVLPHSPQDDRQRHKDISGSLSTDLALIV